MLYFVFGRSKPLAPTRLDLRKNAKSDAPEIVPEKERVAVAKDVSLLAKDVTPLATFHSRIEKKGFSVFFMYNGHEWEAFEVLGLPKGCDVKATTSQYQNLIKTSDPSMFEFFEQAYSAILKSKQN